MCGLTAPPITTLVEHLPFVEFCHLYRFRYNARRMAENIPLLARNPSGCARAEPARRVRIAAPPDAAVCSGVVTQAEHKFSCHALLLYPLVRCIYLCV